MYVRVGVRDGANIAERIAVYDGVRYGTGWTRADWRLETGDRRLETWRLGREDKAARLQSGSMVKRGIAAELSESSPARRAGRIKLAPEYEAAG